MAKCFVDDTSLTSIAEAIRTKGGTTDQLVFPAGFISAIEAIETGGGDFDFSSLADVNFVKSGSFTPTSDTGAFGIVDSELISADLKFFILYTESVLTNTSKYLPLALIQAEISDETAFLLGVWSNGLTSFTVTNTSYFKPFKFNATSGATITDSAIGFNAKNNYVACQKTTAGIIIRGSSFRGSSSYQGLFEAGSTYKYVVLGVK